MSFQSSFESFAMDVIPHGITPALTDRLRQLARPLQLDRRATAKLEAERDQLVFVACGAIKLVATNDLGTEQIVSFHFAGDVASFSRHDAQVMQIVALRPCELLIFDTREVLALARQDAQLSEDLTMRAIRSLQNCREHALALGRRSAQERVACFLMAMRKLRAVSTDRGTTLHLPMTRREIADCLGLTVETVSRQFSQLRAAGLIATPSRTIVTLLDPGRLAERTGSASTPI